MPRRPRQDDGYIRFSVRPDTYKELVKKGKFHENHDMLIRRLMGMRQREWNPRTTRGEDDEEFSGT